MAIINSFDSWTTLREVWLGDVYPAEWYEDLDPEVRDVFQQITEWTQSDLARIERKLTNEFGVTVQRPRYEDINNFIDLQFPGKNILIKPEITPRDYFVTIGNTLYAPDWKIRDPAWQHVFESYQADVDSKVLYHDLEITLSGANTVRAGQDIFVDCVWAIERNSVDNIEQYFQERVVPMFPDHTVHYLSNGGHVDACFSILKPGYLIANRYFEDYDQTFPGWQRLMLSDPTYHNHSRYKQGFGSNGRFWLPDGFMPEKSSQNVTAFNEHVIKYAQEWVGNYTETFFEVNCLVIDEKNVMVLGENEAVFRYLESIGITPHPVDFRCRTFWDGGLHCLTVDIRRDGKIAKYL